jgi:hypothetical protein
MGQLTTDLRHHVNDSGSQRAATIALVLGILAVAATVFTYALSLGTGFNPPNWVRVAGLVWLPLGFFGAPIAYMLARNGPGHGRALIGLAATGVGLTAFVVLLFVAG